jgi:hypothetical protein
MFGFAKKLVSTIESQLSSEVSGQSSSRIDESRQGLRILSVKPNSIGSNHGFESWFDFIMSLNGTDIHAYLEINTSTGYVSYENMMNFIKHEVEISGNNITFTVFSSKGSIVRDIVITAEEIKNEINKVIPPLEEINLSNDSNTSNDYSVSQWTPKLGISFQLTPLSTGFYTWHVLRVAPGSPAYLAGIMPDEYIIQSQDGLLATGGEDLLSKVLQSQYVKNGDNHEIVLYVYNYDSDCVRPVRVVLKAGYLWGGKGILGCDVGYGLLHRIPEVIGKFENTKRAIDALPLAKQANSAGYENSVVPEIPLTHPPEYLPLQVSAPSFASDNNGETVDEASKFVVTNQNRKRGTHNAPKHANLYLDAYFDEQTKINKDNDVGNSTKLDSNAVPPPPKRA